MTDPWESIPLPGLSRLLDTSKGRPGPPIAALLARLQRDDGAWASAALSQPPVGEGVAEAVLLGPDVEGTDRARVHQAAKALVASASTQDEADRGRLWYVLAIAGGILKDRVCLTSQQPQAVMMALMDLAPDMPEPWNEHLAQAALEIDLCD